MTRSPRPLRAALFAATLVWAGPALTVSAAPDDIHSLATEALVLFETTRETEARRVDATASVTAEVRALEASVQQLQLKPMDDEQLRKQAAQVARLEAQLAAARAQLEMGRIKDPDQRAELLKALPPQLDGVRQRLRTAQEPFSQRLTELRNQATVLDDRITQLIRPYFRTPEDGAFVVDRLRLQSRVQSAMVTVNWQDQRGRNLANAVLNLRPKPTAPAGAKRLNQTHWIEQSNARSIRVWAGHYRVVFTAQKREWRGEIAAINALQALVDLDGLAKIDARQGKADLAWLTTR